MPATPKLCVHCHKGKANRPRGLCWSCYYKPGLRDQYEPDMRYTRRLTADDPDRSHLPATGHYSCLWCRHQCNERPMALCVQCQAEFFERRQRAERDPKWATLGD